MADAKGLNTAGLILQGAGALTSAVGAYYGAKSQSRMLKFQAYMADLNAKYADKAAMAVQRRGEMQQQAVRLKGAQLKGQQRVGMAANGIDLSSDTATRILAGTDLMTEVDALTIEQNALEEKWNVKRQATDYRNQSGLASATSAGLSPFGSAAGSLLGDAGAVAQGWYRWSKETK